MFVYVSVEHIKDNSDLFNNTHMIGIDPWGAIQVQKMCEKVHNQVRHTFLRVKNQYLFVCVCKDGRF